MSTPNSDYIITGKIGSPYGIKGWLKVQSFTEDVLAILQYKPWYIAEGSGWKAVEIEEGRQQGKGVVVKLPGYNTPETARILTGRNIAIKREQLAPLPQNEYYWADLEGLTVVDQRGKTLGQIAYLLATGGNDVFVIKDAAGKEHALPYLLGSVVKEIDLKQRRMTVDWDLI